MMFYIKNIHSTNCTPPTAQTATPDGHGDDACVPSMLAGIPVQPKRIVPKTFTIKYSHHIVTASLRQDCRTGRTKQARYHVIPDGRSGRTHPALAPVLPLYEGRRHRCVPAPPYGTEIQRRQRSPPCPPHDTAMPTARHRHAHRTTPPCPPHGGHHTWHGLNRGPITPI